MNAKIDPPFPTRKPTSELYMLMGDRNLPFAVERSAWTEEAALREALFWRGTIVSAWAYAETCLLEIAIRSSVDDAYHGIRDTYPHKMPGRLEYLGRILREPGPLAEYRAKGERLLSDFAEGAEVRHLMAHGRMRVTSADWIFLDRFNGTGPLEIKHETRRFTTSELQSLAEASTSVSQRCQRALGLIDQRQLLGPLQHTG